MAEFVNLGYILSGVPAAFPLSGLPPKKNSLTYINDPRRSRATGLRSSAGVDGLCDSSR